MIHRPLQWGVAAALLGCLLVTPPAAADRGGYRIESFDVELTVQADSDLLVTERIDVDFSEPRHGIYRTIPVRYTDPRGFGYSLGLRHIEAEYGDGRSVPVRISNEGQYRMIRLGDKDREVSGRVSYVLHYVVRDALGHFAEHDELYWNVTGHEWNTTIARAAATVRLPGTPPAEVLEAAGYTGAFGSREQAVSVAQPGSGVVRFESTGPFAPLEGLTVVVTWPTGEVHFAGAGTRIARFLVDNWVLLLPLVWLGFLWSRYQRSGRDPEPEGPVMVQYEPPPDLTPGGVGALIDEKVDLRDITATVVDLAVRGYLTIRVEEKDALFGLVHREETVFERAADRSTEDLRPHEREVLTALFESGDVVDTGDLENKFYKHLPSIRSAAFDRLVADGYFAASPEKVRQRWTMAGLGVGAATGLAGAAWLWMRGAVMPAALPVPVVAGILTVLFFVAFAPAMPRRTAAGARARRWALGFQEFAGRVEGERLGRQDPRQLFESLLPYAMALAVAGDWARRFEGIYAEEAPRWYGGGSYSHGFSTRAFERSLSSAMTRAGKGMRTAPRSSGSGGGGFSGGGGGGGGGGSW